VATNPNLQEFSLWIAVSYKFQWSKSIYATASWTLIDQAETAEI